MDTGKPYTLSCCLHSAMSVGLSVFFVWFFLDAALKACACHMVLVDFGLILGRLQKDTAVGLGSLLNLCSSKRNSSAFMPII